MGYEYNGRVYEDHEIDGGPPPAVGSDIYVGSAYYISHGEDDFVGGLCKVAAVTIGISAGKPTWFVSVEERPGRSSNWKMLKEKHDALKARHGTERGRMNPDPVSDYDRDESPWK